MDSRAGGREKSLNKKQYIRTYLYALYIITYILYVQEILTHCITTYYKNGIRHILPTTI